MVRSVLICVALAVGFAAGLAVGRIGGDPGTHAPPESAPRAVVDAKTETLPAVRRDSVIRGTLFDWSNAPIAGVEVSASPDSAPPLPPPSAEDPESARAAWMKACADWLD